MSHKAREVLEELRGLDIADRPAFAKAISSLSKFEDQLLDLGCPFGEIDELIRELEHFRGERVVAPGEKLRDWLRFALDEPLERSTIESLSEIRPTYKPKFPSGIAALDMKTEGGLYGLCVCCGDAKSGKTTFAISAACAASRAGWRTLLLNGELDRNEITLAILRHCGGEVPKYITEMLRVVTVDFGFTPHDAVVRGIEQLQSQDDRMLVVLDSINALVDMSSASEQQNAGGGDARFWAANALWRNWAIRATRASLGQIAFLVVSETNKDGGIKGRTLEYKSDIVVRVARDKEDAEMVEIDVTHSRSTRGGEVGRFRRNWGKGRFEFCG